MTCICEHMHVCEVNEEYTLSHAKIHIYIIISRLITHSNKRMYIFTNILSLTHTLTQELYSRRVAIACHLAQCGCSVTDLIRDSWTAGSLCYMLC